MGQDLWDRIVGKSCRDLNQELAVGRAATPRHLEGVLCLPSTWGPSPGAPPSLCIVMSCQEEGL